MAKHSKFKRFIAVLLSVFMAMSSMVFVPATENFPLENFEELLLFDETEEFLIFDASEDMFFDALYGNEVEPLFTTTRPNRPINTSMTAAQIVAGIGAGWNLGNTFEARAHTETAWGAPTTTQEHIAAVQAAGFNAIRIPVTWTIHNPTRTDGQTTNPSSNFKGHAQNNWTISEGFMRRVETVVGWAYDLGMYVIINSHHDDAVQLQMVSNPTLSDQIHTRIWDQVAGYFNHQFGERLIFAGSNEPRTVLTSFDAGTPEERDAINRQHQIFVNRVRATQGNNTHRTLGIMPRAASGTTGALGALTLPSDPTPNRLVLMVHTYSPHDFAFARGTDRQSFNPSATQNNHTNPNCSGHTNWWCHCTPERILNYFGNIQSRANAMGLPVMLTEWGSVNKNNTAAREAHARYYVEQATNRGWPTFWWDNMQNTTGTERFGIFNRSNNTWLYPTIVTAIMNGVGDPNQQAVNAAANGVTWDTIRNANSSAGNVTTNLTLPTTRPGGVSVAWSSSNTAVVSNTGVVTRPSTGTASITLTATFTLGGASTIRTFNLSVPAAGGAANVLEVPTGRHAVFHMSTLGLQPGTVLDGIGVAPAGGTATITPAGAIRMVTGLTGYAGGWNGIDIIPGEFGGLAPGDIVQVLIELESIQPGADVTRLPVNNGFRIEDAPGRQLPHSSMNPAPDRLDWDGTPFGFLIAPGAAPRTLSVTVDQEFITANNSEWENGSIIGSATPPRFRVAPRIVTAWVPLVPGNYDVGDGLDGRGGSTFVVHDILVHRAGAGDPLAAARAALQGRIADANALLANTQTSTNGADVATNAYWTTLAIRNTFTAAITTAENALPGTSQAALDTARTNLNTAITTFENARALGVMAPPSRDVIISGGGTGASATPPSAAPGATVTLNAGTREGFIFANWSATGASFTNGTSAIAASFIMPSGSGAFTVTANWTPEGGGPFTFNLRDYFATAPATLTFEDLATELPHGLGIHVERHSFVNDANPVVDTTAVGSLVGTGINRRIDVTARTANPSGLEVTGLLPGDTIEVIVMQPNNNINPAPNPPWVEGGNNFGTWGARFDIWHFSPTGDSVQANNVENFPGIGDEGRLHTSGVAALGLLPTSGQLVVPAVGGTARIVTQRGLWSSPATVPPGSDLWAGVAHPNIHIHNIIISGTREGGTPDTWVVTFDPAGGERTSGGELIQTVDNGASAILPIVIRPGFNFAGWTGSHTNVTSDRTITASWTPAGSGGDWVWCLSDATAANLSNTANDQTVVLSTWGPANIALNASNHLVITERRAPTGNSSDGALFTFAQAGMNIAANNYRIRMTGTVGTSTNTGTVNFRLQGMLDGNNVANMAGVHDVSLTGGRFDINFTVGPGGAVTQAMDSMRLITNAAGAGADITIDMFRVTAFTPAAPTTWGDFIIRSGGFAPAWPWLTTNIVEGAALPRANGWTGDASGHLLRGIAAASPITWANDNGKLVLRSVINDPESGGINQGVWINPALIPANHEIVLRGRAQLGTAATGAQISVNHGGGGTEGFARADVSAVAPAFDDFEMIITSAWLAAQTSPAAGIRLEANTTARTAAVTIYITHFEIRPASSTTPDCAACNDAGCVICNAQLAVNAARDALTWASISGGQDVGAVISNLTLPTSGANGVTVSWQSNNSAITNAGAVTRPSFPASNATGSLVATLTRGTATASVTFQPVVTALAAVTNNVTINSPGTGHSSSPANPVAQGTIVTLNAGTNPGHNFVNWSSTSPGVSFTNETSATQATFIMPSNSVTVTANWVAATPVLTTLAAPPETRGLNAPVTNAGEVISQLPQTAAITTVPSLPAGTSVATIAWQLAASSTFDASSGATNSFTWTATLPGGVTNPNNVPVTGTTVVTNFDMANQTVPVITTTDNPSVIDGAWVDFQFEAEGLPPPTWSVIGSLPQGLELRPDGRLRGIPVFAGEFEITVEASNSAGSATQNVTINIDTRKQPNISDDPTLLISIEFADRGERVTVNFRLTNNPGFANMMLRVDFPDGLTLVDYESHPTLKEEALFPGLEGDLNREEYFFGWIRIPEYEGHDTNLHVEGPILTLTFDVCPTAERGSFKEISAAFATTQASEFPTQFRPNDSGGEDYELTNFKIEYGGVVVRELLPGDVNGDGYITSLDGTVLARWLIGHHIPRFDIDAVNLNNNGVSAATLTTLARMLVGHNVSLFDVNGS